MQTIIDFLVNNYLWFLIISLILIFALIGYLVDTSERAKKEDFLENDSLEEPNKEPLKVTETLESLNMDMGVDDTKELDKDVIVMPKLEETNGNSIQEEKETEILEIE